MPAFESYPVKLNVNLGTVPAVDYPVKLNVNLNGEPDIPEHAVNLLVNLEGGVEVTGAFAHGTEEFFHGTNLMTHGA